MIFATADSALILRLRSRSRRYARPANARNPTGAPTAAPTIVPVFDFGDGAGAVEDEEVGAENGEDVAGRVPGPEVVVIGVEDVETNEPSVAVKTAFRNDPNVGIKFSVEQQDPLYAQHHWPSRSSQVMRLQ